MSRSVVRWSTALLLVGATLYVALADGDHHEHVQSDAFIHGRDELMEELSAPNYWDSHGLLFLLGLAIAPRLTLCCCTGFLCNTGCCGILLFVLFPHLLVAWLATAYWDANWVLVTGAWVMFLLGECAEKGGASAVQGQQELRMRRKE